MNQIFIQIQIFFNQLPFDIVFAFHCKGGLDYQLRGCLLQIDVFNLSRHRLPTVMEVVVLFAQMYVDVIISGSYNDQSSTDRRRSILEIKKNN